MTNQYSFVDGDNLTEEQLVFVAKKDIKIPAEFDPEHVYDEERLLKRVELIKTMQKPYFFQVVMSGEKIVGFHIVSNMNHLSRKVANTLTLWVDPVYRKLGIAKELKTRGIDWAIKQGYPSIQTHVNIKNQRMIEINKGFGFSNDMFLMKKSLPSSTLTQLEVNNYSLLTSIANNKLLIGKNISLIPIQADHREQLRLNATDNRVWAFNTLIAKYSDDLFNTWFTLAYNNSFSRTEQCFVISKNQKLIGSSRYYMIKPEAKEISIGFTWIHPDFWGSSVNPEMKFLMISNALEMGFEKILFHVDNMNLHSQKAMEKLGATLVTKSKWTRMRLDGSTRHTYEYEITKTSWPQISDKLLKRIDDINGDSLTT